MYGAAGAGRGGVLKWRPPPCPVSAFVCCFLRGGLVISVLRPVAVRGWGRGREDGTDGPAPARARLVSLLLSRGVLPLSPPPPSPAGGRGGARLVRGWDRSRRRPSALHASSRAGAGAQVNKGRLPRNFRLDKSERTCYYTGARLVSGPWAPAFEQSVTLGESVVRKGGAFFGPFSARKREIFRRSLPGSGMPGSQHNQPGKIPV